MGTSFFTDKLLPAAYPHGGRRRQVEIYRPSGEQHLELRIGELDEEHQGRGHTVELNEEDARELLSGLLSAMHYLGYRTDDLR